MTLNERIWLTFQTHQRLQAELSELQADGTSSTPDNIERVRQIRELLNKAVIGEDPPDDGVAEPGMVLTIRYDDGGDTETFLLGVREVEQGNELEVYSTQSPMGSVLIGARRGEQRTYQAPNGRTIAVTLLEAVPYGQHHPS